MISELCEMVKIYQVMIMWSLSGSHNDSFYNTRMMIPNFYKCNIYIGKKCIVQLFTTR